MCVLVKIVINSPKVLLMGRLRSNLIIIWRHQTPHHKIWGLSLNLAPGNDIDTPLMMTILMITLQRENSKIECGLSWSAWNILNFYPLFAVVKLCVRVCVSKSLRKRTQTDTKVTFHNTFNKYKPNLPVKAKKTR